MDNIESEYGEPQEITITLEQFCMVTREISFRNLYLARNLYMRAHGHSPKILRMSLLAADELSMEPIFSGGPHGRVSPGDSFAGMVYEIDENLPGAQWMVGEVKEETRVIRR